MKSTRANSDSEPSSINVSALSMSALKANLTSRGIALNNALKKMELVQLLSVRVLTISNVAGKNEQWFRPIFLKSVKTNKKVKKKSHRT